MLASFLENFIEGAHFGARFQKAPNRIVDISVRNVDCGAATGDIELWNAGELRSSLIKSVEDM